MSFISTIHIIEKQFLDFTYNGLPSHIAGVAEDDDKYIHISILYHRHNIRIVTFALIVLLYHSYP
ncbi:MAG: hypothetical protein CM15mV8_1790 [Caudoviricetes sp.]|nr:MAG: hypothetical protein CM15mV8_1790 [Caudoviricetes sp.]